MNKIKILVGLILVALFLWNCEKDDICDQTVTTPQLVVTFYDIENPSLTKNVTRLLVSKVEADPLQPIDTLAVFNAVSTISLPLRTTDNTAQYRFLLNSDNALISKVDTITFNYSRNDVYVSRACGYKTLFTLNSPTPFILSQNALAAERWIQDISVNQENIQDEDETHINIYF